MILQSPIFSGSVQISGSIILNDGPITATANIVSASTITDTFTSATSKVVNHGFDTKNVFVQVYNTSDELINPGSITTTDVNNVTITFPTPVSGRVIVGKSGHLVSGSAIAQSVEFENILNKPALVSGSLDFVNITNKPALVSGSNIASSSLAKIAERVQAGTTGSRDLTTPQSGSLWYNTNTGNLELYNGSGSFGWEPLNNVKPGIPNTVEYLVVGGGGAGGGYVGGGGGAGGFLEGEFTLGSGVVYTATVGAGASSYTNTSSATSPSGQNSTLAGIDITTVTAYGGGGGSNYNDGIGGAGGSGGGAGGMSGGGGTGGAGTAGQGNDGGSASGGRSGTPTLGSGGGGAFAAGGTGYGGGSTTAPAGGAGKSSTVCPDGYTYSGGGGAGLYNSSTTTGTGGNGGTGGGGGGGHSAPGGTPGSGGLLGRNNGGQGVAADPGGGGNGGANTGGGGGGGGHNSNQGCLGGSGIVILKVLTLHYTGITTGSPTIQTDSTHTYVLFLSSGTYTA